LRTSKIDDVFDREEQEFLHELADQGIEEGEATIAELQTSKDFETVDDLKSLGEMALRQRRRIQFLNSLRDATEVNE
jgi:hypothetical protein